MTKINVSCWSHSSIKTIIYSMYFPALQWIKCMFNVCFWLVCYFFNFLAFHSQKAYYFQWLSMTLTKILRLSRPGNWYNKFHDLYDPCIYIPNPTQQGPLVPSLPPFSSIYFRLQICVTPSLAFIHVLLYEKRHNT